MVVPHQDLSDDLQALPLTAAELAELVERGWLERRGMVHAPTDKGLRTLGEYSRLQSAAGSDINEEE